MSKLLGDLVTANIRNTQFPIIVNELLECQACSARWEASKPVPPTGPYDAKILVIGRNPGTQEDLTGIPFHPEAPGGSELSWYLKLAAINRDKCFITNCVNCHTWEDREPVDSERTICTKLYAERFIALVKPNLIIACGRQAVESMQILESGDSLMRHHSIPKRTRFGVVWPIPHPAVVCYDESKRRIMKQSAYDLSVFMSQCADKFGKEFWGEAWLTPQ